MRKERLETAAFRLGYLAICGFMLLPLLVVVVTSFADSSQLAFPPESYSLATYQAFFAADEWLRAFDNSLIVGLGTTVVATVLGVTAAFGQELDDGRLGEALVPLVILPLLIPPVIFGVTLLVYFNRLGLQGSYASLILAHTLWATPLVYFVMRSVFSRFDWQQLDAAYDLGASPTRGFLHVVLPNVKHGIFVAALLAFIVSLQEFVMALFLSTPGRNGTATIPVVAWNTLRDSLDPMVSVVSTFLIAISLIAIVLAALATNLQWVSKQLS